MKQEFSTQGRNIKPLSKPIQAVVSVPGSKSLTNRALLLAALANGKTALKNALFSDDPIFFAQSLQMLGFDIFLDAENANMEIAGLSGSIPLQKAKLYIGNAGTAARFLTAFLTLGTGNYILDGDSRMRERPIGDLLMALTQLGAQVKGTEHLRSTVCPPIEIIASGLTGGKAGIAGNISSQFLSALLMVAPYADTPVEINITTELNSKPYVDLTLSIMAEFGVNVERDGFKCFLIYPAKYRPISEYLIESDASSASYFFATPAICGGSVRVENISRKSKQGDMKFLDILEKMGCLVKENNNSVEVIGSEQIVGVDVDMGDISDTAQTLAAIAPFASSPTHIHGIASARVKETDRIAATCMELRRIGVQVDEHEDGLTIYPAEKTHSALIHTYNDHRMAMAFSLIGLRVPGISIENPGCVAKTFPDFFDRLEHLR
jgi:3-phosphoshikimate 1-carboxyvinyltransferase